MEPGLGTSIYMGRSIPIGVHSPHGVAKETVTFDGSDGKEIRTDIVPLSFRMIHKVVPLDILEPPIFSRIGGPVQNIASLHVQIARDGS